MAGPERCVVQVSPFCYRFCSATQLAPGHGAKTVARRFAKTLPSTVLVDDTHPLPHASLFSTFEALAATAGAREALLEPGREPLRFADLPARLRDIRDSLASHGIGRGDRVASALPRGADTAVCFLAVASCAIHVPLNPAYSEAEFTRYLAKLRPAALIVAAHDAAGRSSAAALGIPIVDLVADERGPPGAFELRHHETRDPVDPAWNTHDDVALVLLTSGTTSEQKFVPIRQRHLLAYARASGEFYQLGPRDRGLHVMPMFHGHGLKSSLLVPLANGSGVICTREFDVGSFLRQVTEMDATWYSAAAAIHQAILQRLDGNRDAIRGARLRFMRSGSARLDPKVMTGLENAFGAPMLERYGMSETCTLTSHALPPHVRRAGTVGTAMFNDVAIIDASGNAVSEGTLGEIVARGPGVIDGYFDDPVATAAAFVDGWFRTGDLGRLDGDGYLTLCGRIKDVINRGGEKIGTGEVESVLLGHPAVAQACVSPIPHPTLGEEVAAAVVLAPSMRVNERELRSHAARMLTGFKVPRRIAVRTALPVNATSKVGQAEIERIRSDMLNDAARAVDVTPVPWTVLERQIATLWADALDIAVGDIGRDDDFFLLGGDSLQVYELFVHLRSRYGIAVGLADLFDDASTVAGMARMVERSSDGSTAARGARRLVPIKEDGDWPPLFALPGSGGNPVGYVHLGRLLDRRQPLIGIESRGLDGSSLPLTRVEDIAKDNLAAIRAVQPTGPYFIAGACYGARVAYEMARQLEQAGERIGLLLMLDPSSPFHAADGRRRGASAEAGVKPRTVTTRFVLNRILLHVSTLARLKGEERSAYVREKAGVLRDIVRRRDLFRGDRSELHQRLVHAANRQAGGRYVPGPFGGPVVLCFTRDRPVKGARNYRLDWLDIVPQCGGPCYVAGNDSGQMLSVPHVYELSEAVNRWLRTAHAQPGIDARVEVA